MVQKAVDTGTRRDAPAIGEIARIATETLQQVLGDRIVAAFLYGSVVTARDRADSDLDVALLEREGAPLPWNEQAEVADLLERACRRPIDLQTLRRGSASYLVHVLSEGILLYCTDASALEQFQRAAQVALDRTRLEQEPIWRQVLHAFANRDT